jgi:hypothetical protein
VLGILDVDKEVEVLKEAIENLNGWIVNQNNSDSSYIPRTYSSLTSDGPETSTSENQENKKLNLDIGFSKDPIRAGNVEKVTTTITEQDITEQDNSDEISGVSVNGLITYVSGQTKSFSGMSDTNGEVSHSWTIDENSAPGKYRVNVDASVVGFEGSSESKSFEVQAKSNQKASSTSDSSSKTDDSSGDSSRCDDGSHRSPSGDCERVTNTKGMPRCDDGYHRSPSGHCERVQ